MEPILELLSKNCLYSTKDMAAMLDMTEEEIEEKIALMELEKNKEAGGEKG